MRRRKNPYSGILKPVLVGAGPPEVSCVLIYDIESDRLRNRISEACLDYGLERIQYSAFFGKLSRNRRQELALRLRSEVKDETAKIRVIPVCQADLDQMWMLEQLSPDKPARVAPARPKLRIIPNTE